MWIELIALLISGAGAIYLLIRKHRGFWKNHGFPHHISEFSIPWKSTGGSQVRASTIDVVSTLYKSYPNEKFVGFWSMLKPTLLIRDTDIIKSVLIRDFNYFHDRGIYYNEKSDPISGHLIALSGAKWKNIRVKITPAFSSGKMKTMFPLITHVGENLKMVVLEAIKDNPIIDLPNLLQRYTTDVVSLTSFGLESNSLKDPNAPFRQFGLKIFSPNGWDIMRAVINSATPSLSKLLNLRVFRKEISDYYLSTLKSTMDYREKNDVKRSDLVDILLDLKKNGRLDANATDSARVSEDDKFEERDAAAQAFIFFAAGFETSSTAMTFTLYELSKHQDMQERARNEINTVLNKYNGELSYDALSEMKYLSMILDETLRLYPPARMLSRICSKNYPIPGTNLVIPKGVRIVLSVYEIHHDPQYYPDPETFKPERFTEEEKANRPSCLYLPFGDGPRNCIGMRFGLLQSKCGLAHLLSKCRFEATKQTPLQMAFNPKATLLQPDGDMHIKITAL